MAYFGIGEPIAVLIMRSVALSAKRDDLPPLAFGAAHAARAGVCRVGGSRATTGRTGKRDDAVSVLASELLESEALAARGIDGAEAGAALEAGLAAA